VRFVNTETVITVAATAHARLCQLRIGLVNTIMEGNAMTNGDWVRSLDDESLAKWLDIFDMDICEDCPKSNDRHCEEILCHSQWRKWVKQEHKSNSFN
jgi:hypothetical protein